MAGKLMREGIGGFDGKDAMDIYESFFLGSGNFEELKKLLIFLRLLRNYGEKMIAEPNQEIETLERSIVIVIFYLKNLLLPYYNGPSSQY